MRARSWTAVAIVAVGACAGGGTGAALALAHGSSAATMPAGARPTDAAATAPDSSAPKPVPPALTVTRVTHATATTAVADLGAVSITFSAPIDGHVHPTLAPAIAGTWTRTGATTLTFVPTAVPLPGQTLVLSVAAGTRDVAGGALARTYSTSWQTRAGDPARLQELLAEDGYLPRAFIPAAPEPTTAAGLAASAFAPVPGTYTPRFSAPPSLQALWTGATSTLLTRGAVLAFESAHGLATDGSAGPAVWAALTTALASGAKNTSPYTYVSVTKARPETLTLWQNGKAVLTTPANTGVAGAATPDGSWAVYARYRSETMSGTNPDGTHYSDPGVPWISYFYGGDAVHGFPRATYGSPQSVGCVELPIPTAAKVYALMGYGDIVTVSG